MGQLQMMLMQLTQMMSMLSGQGQAVNPAVQQTPLIQQNALATNPLLSPPAPQGSLSSALFPPTQQIPGLTGMNLTVGNPLSNASPLVGANPLTSPNIFSQQLNLGVVDSAINQALGGIANTLPIVNL
jgi:hypothetical protein